MSFFPRRLDDPQAKAAMDQQIIVFSRRQLAFASLGGARSQIALRDAA